MDAIIMVSQENAHGEMTEGVVAQYSCWAGCLALSQPAMLRRRCARAGVALWILLAIITYIAYDACYSPSRRLAVVQASWLVGVERGDMWLMREVPSKWGTAVTIEYGLSARPERDIQDVDFAAALWTKCRADGFEGADSRRKMSSVFLKC